MSHLAPTPFWQEIALGYLAFQLIFSYFQSGYIKIINADWRSGQALMDVFAFTAYPVSEQARKWAESPSLILAISWAVIIFELAFPFSLLNQISLITALFVAVIFHLANACLFGLNRFFGYGLRLIPCFYGFKRAYLCTYLVKSPLVIILSSHPFCTLLDTSMVTAFT